MEPFTFSTSTQNTDLKSVKTACDAPDAPTLCGGRREFLTRCVAGGLAIALGATFLGNTARAAGDDETAAPAKKAEIKDGELLIKPEDYPELAKPGGYVTLDTEAGKIVVARVEETKFVAVGAVCTHKGGPIQYDADNSDFFCPWHKSRFAQDGAVTKGPAKLPLPSYAGEPAVVLKMGEK